MELVGYGWRLPAEPSVPVGDGALFALKRGEIALMQAKSPR
jgi:hypothetical protein